PAPDSPINTVRAQPGMTRMSPKTISDESRSTGTDSSSRRITYLYMACRPTAYPVPSPTLLVQPRPGEGWRAVPVRAAQRARGHVPHLGLVDQEAVVVRHPHPQHLIILAIHDLLGDRALLGPVASAAQR